MTERRFISRAYIALGRLFLSAAPCKNQGTSPQSAQSPQRGGGAGVREDGWSGGAFELGAALFQCQQTNFINSNA
ncbi:MAG: hypothetical protein O8C67_10215 [Candidatus Methanoperedens sp.]|nr:hypothetical protein [Candidatus Methanoperedens sp.]